MNDLIKIEDVQSRMLMVRGNPVLFDYDMAELYDVETKAINQAVRRNAERFFDGYVLTLTPEECSRSQIVTLNGKRGSNRNRILARTQLLHRQAQTRRPPLSSRRTPERKKNDQFRTFSLFTFLSPWQCKVINKFLPGAVPMESKQ